MALPKIPKKKSLAKKIKWILFLSLIFFVVLLIILVISFVFVFEKRYEKTFYPGISIAGESVGGKSYAEVLNYFKAKADLIDKNGITFDIKGEKGLKQVQVPAFSKGLTTDKVAEHFSLDDWENALKNGYKAGRQGSFWENIKEQYSIYFEKRNFVFSPVIQKESIDSFFKGELEDFLLKTTNAEFNLENGKISILPETIGEKIDADKITKTLKEKLSAFDTSPASLSAEKETPVATAEKLKQFSDFAEKLKTSAKIVFHYNDYSWKVSGDTLITWLTVKQNGKIGIDEKKLEDYFNKTVILYIDSPMQNSHFEMQNNKLVEISHGKAGNVADIKKNTQNLEKIISDMYLNQDAKIDVVNINIETTVEEPKITKETIDQYKIKELAGSAETNFQGGSLDRQHNIEVGVSKLNGILLAPGEEFSAVKAIGDVTEEAGFVEEYVISGEKTQKEIGGGLCQLATTLFRLALNTGLPIIERINHRYVISYYGAGLDATIYGPHPDLRFINDTGNYLLLQGKAENNKVLFEFYGVKDGRLVEISKPKLYNWVSPPDAKLIPSTDIPLGKTKCTEIPHSGVTADATYTVTYLNGEKKETKFHSVYQPWQKVCLIGITKTQ